jgi:hypothetical protein
MDQFIPQVSEADVHRIVKRDYSPNQHAMILDMIENTEKKESARIVLACLKTANGDIEKLKSQLADSGGYWREIISKAEYPNYSKKLFQMDRLSEAEQQAIIDVDKSQYLNWLNID